MTVEIGDFLANVSWISMNLSKLAYRLHVLFILVLSRTFEESAKADDH